MNIFDAVRNNDIKAVKKYIENGGDVNAKDNYGWTALMYAIRNGKTELAKLWKSQNRYEYFERKLFKRRGRK
jgi:ankyrin repeat protein